MDINMPVMNGIEATRIASKKYPGIQILGHSVYEESIYEEIMKSAGAKKVIPKTDLNINLMNEIHKAFIHSNRIAS